MGATKTGLDFIFFEVFGRKDLVDFFSCEIWGFLGETWEERNLAGFMCLKFQLSGLILWETFKLSLDSFLILSEMFKLTLLSVEFGF